MDEWAGTSRKTASNGKEKLMSIRTRRQIQTKHAHMHAPHRMSLVATVQMANYSATR